VLREIEEQQKEAGKERKAAIKQLDREVKAFLNLNPDHLIQEMNLAFEGKKTIKENREKTA
jgi:hypothetical protein